MSSNNNDNQANNTTDSNITYSASNPDPTTVSCTYVFDRFMYCSTPMNQINKMRRFGQYEECFRWLEDWTTCLQAKFVTDEGKKNEKMRSIRGLQKDPNAVINDVWELKSKPTWVDAE